MLYVVRKLKTRFQIPLIIPLRFCFSSNRSRDWITKSPLLGQARTHVSTHVTTVRNSSRDSEGCSALY